MLRTRDFFLFLVIAGFLVLAIGVEAMITFFIPADDQEPPVLVEINPGEVATKTAEVVIAPDGRSERIAKLREIIAKMTDITPSESLVNQEPIADEVVTETDVTYDIRLCPDHRSYTGSWTVAGLTMTEREGVRIWHTPSASTTDAELGEVRLILPMREFRSPEPTCLGLDVIGVAKDGSLIRNNEYGLYSVFGGGTLIGYALDGFPIYGLSETLTDECGGATENGSYRYYLNSERKGVISCFASVPTPL